jgi:hypothetical protein
MEVPVHLDAETLLTRSLRGIMPLIALGKAGGVDEGVARISSSDEDWRQTIEALARQATFIVMVPLSRPSTMWELHWLVDSGLINKVLFIMPETPFPAPDGVWVFTETGDRVFDAGIRTFNAEAHMLNLPKEWLEAVRVAEGLGLHFPPLAAVGAIFTLDTSTRITKEIVPLALASVMRPIFYLRENMRHLGVLEGSWSANFEETFRKAVYLGGVTLEFALVRAADGMVVWGQYGTAGQLLKSALDEGRPKSRFVNEYFSSLPALLNERVMFDDQLASAQYLEFQKWIRQDARLGSLVTDEVANAIERAASDKSTE